VAWVLGLGADLGTCECSDYGVLVLGGLTSWWEEKACFEHNTSCGDAGLVWWLVGGIVASDRSVVVTLD
jgi:hypothetical protein